MADPVFVWGSVDGPSCISSINSCYDEAIHWKPNLFRLPSGRVGESELSRLFNDYANASALESVALTLSRIATPFGDARGRGKTSLFYRLAIQCFLKFFWYHYHKQSNGIKNKVIDAIHKKKMASKVWLPFAPPTLVTNYCF